MENLYYKISNLDLDVKFKNNTHTYNNEEKHFPKILEIIHKGDNIIELIDINLLESIQSDIYKKINNINSND